MLLTVTIAAVMYAVLVVSNGTTVTPDGHYYLAMGRGYIAPRPYAYRFLPRVVTSIMGWRILHGVSWLLLAVATHVLGAQFGLNGTYVAIAILALPSLRQSVSWPVLLDVPLLAFAALLAVFSVANPFWAVLVLPLLVLVHERAPFVAALYCLPFVPVWWLAVALVAVVVIVAVIHDANEPHPDERAVDWLRNPFKAAIARHRSTCNNWEVWVKPLGLTFAGVFTGGYWSVVALAFGYAGCLMAQDRARIYTVAALPLTIAAVSTFGQYGAIVALVNWFTITNEV